MRSLKFRCYRGWQSPRTEFRKWTPKIYSVSTVPQPQNVRLPKQYFDPTNVRYSSSPGIRYFSTLRIEKEAIGPALQEEWPEHEFVKVAESTLECIAESISDIGFGVDFDMDDLDVDLSQGVLTVNLGPHGTYVMNTQTPNRQIWMSSPKSGPWRYAWHPHVKKWLSTRDGHDLDNRVTKEISDIFGTAFSVDYAALHHVLEDLTPVHAS